MGKEQGAYKDKTVVMPQRGYMINRLSEAGLYGITPQTFVSRLVD